MPHLFALGQHLALVVVQRSLRGDERLLALLEDIYIIASPARTGAVVASLQQHLFTHARIRLHGGKTQVWNGAGIRPPACEALDQIARALDPRDVVWKGPELPVEEQASRCWEHHSATPSLSQIIWSGSWRNTECCWTESQQCRMCNLRG